MHERARGPYRGGGIREARVPLRFALVGMVALIALAVVLGAWLAPVRAQSAEPAGPMAAPAPTRAPVVAPPTFEISWPTDAELLPAATAALATRLRSSSQREVRVQVKGEPARGWFFAAVQIDVTGDSDSPAEAAARAALDGVRTWLATTPVSATAAPPDNRLGNPALELAADGPNGRLRGLTTARSTGPGRIQLIGLLCVARGPAQKELDRCLSFLGREPNP